jgi:hypothetical protein
MIRNVHRKTDRYESKRQVRDSNVSENSDVISLFDSRPVVFDICDSRDLRQGQQICVQLIRLRDTNTIPQSRHLSDLELSFDLNI